MDRTIALLASLLALVLVGGYVVLTATGASTTGYVLFVSGPLVSGIVGFVLTRKVQHVQEVTDQVKVQTDGLLAGRMDNLDGQLTAASAERRAIALAPVVLPGPVSVEIKSPGSDDQ